MPRRFGCALLGALLACPGSGIGGECESWCGSSRNPWATCCAWDKCSACTQCAVIPDPCRIPPSNGSSSFHVGLDPYHYVHPNFVSFTIDVYHLRKAWQDCSLSDPQNIALARAMSPAFLRVGGTSQDNVTYDMSSPPEDPPYVPSSRGSDASGVEIIPHSTLAAADWDAMSKFAQAAQWEIVYGLNIFDGWEHGARTWDPTRSLELMNYTKARGYPVVGWELGNEPNLRNKDLQSSEVAASFASLLEEVKKVYATIGSGTSSAPWIIGPDVTKDGPDFMEGALAEMPSPGVGIVTWHHYYVAGSGHPVSPCNFMQADFLNKYCQYAGAMVEAYGNYSARRAKKGHALTQLWMGETSGAGGATAGAKQVQDAFIGIFWYADKLGFAASTGHSVVVRQSWMEARGPIGNPAPEFWLALLWKRLVGQGVLHVAMSSGADSTRCYAHCNADGSVTAVIINLANSTEMVSLNFGASAAVSPFREYHLTSWPLAGDLWSSSLAVNGQPANLTQAGEVPDFMPRVNSQTIVAMSALSVAFVVSPAGSVSTCSAGHVIV